MNERVQWLSAIDPEASRDIYANVPDLDVIAVDTKTGVVYSGEAFLGGMKQDLRRHLGCDEFAPVAVKARATRKMLRVRK